MSETKLRVQKLNGAIGSHTYTHTHTHTHTHACTLGSDMALVLDTARFKYPPFWAPVDRLFQSCATRDQVHLCGACVFARILWHPTCSTRPWCCTSALLPGDSLSALFPRACGCVCAYVLTRFLFAQDTGMGRGYLLLSRDPK